MNEDQIAGLLDLLATIADHLGVVAEYAEMQRIQATGEKVYEVGSYVQSVTSNGDRCVYLYATHPGLQYRVCTVYEERLHELPFVIPAGGKTWDAEVAPSWGGASQRGYLVEAAPFRISLLPTGGVTDAGLPVHRFNRVLPEAPAAGSRGSQTVAPTIPATPVTAREPYDETAREFDARQSTLVGLPPAQSQPAQVGPKVSAGASPLPDAPPRNGGYDPQLCPACGTPWRYENPACREHRPPRIQPALPESATAQPKRQSQATLGAGKVGGAFRVWADDFAKRYPQYRINAHSEDVDMFHILMTVGSFGIKSIEDANLAEVQARLETYALTKQQ